MKPLNEITEDDAYKCQDILKLDNIPDLKYTKRIVARIFTKGWIIEGASGEQIIGIYNYLKDKYILPY